MMVKKIKIRLSPDPKRVLLQFFFPGNGKRAAALVNRIMNLEEGEVERISQKVISDFSDRHRNFESLLMNNYNRIKSIITGYYNISESRKLLIGSYFSKEYSIESAALFNPSVVPHPDQSDLKDGELKFVMSLRATGEGHISSIEFRSGIIDSENKITLDETSHFASMAGHREEKVIPGAATPEANYNISFTGEEPVSERVIFPFSESEKNGIEDVRFVNFINDDGSKTYYGTFTAYDGKRILSQLIQTDDFIKYKIRTLSGDRVKDKGMALFPRKINNKFTMISRIDGENLYYMQSDDIFSWNEASHLKEPRFNWEFVQTGNCGSPLETDKGWILLVHGVGPLRTYVISALLLNKEDPSRITGFLKDPLIEADESERDGYVPNVAYSCGGLIHNKELIVPYAVSDSASGFAIVNLNKLFKKFTLL